MKTVSTPTGLSELDFISQEMEECSFVTPLLNALVSPRPIALITSVGPNGVVNAAPFSYFNIVCTDPPILSIAIQRRRGMRKDTAHNILFLKEFVVNICSLDLLKAVSLVGGDFPPNVSEVELAGFSLLPSSQITVPRIANCLAQMECILHQAISVGYDQSDLILGEIVRTHVHKEILDSAGGVDLEKLNPLARLSSHTYGRVDALFDLPRGL